MRRKQLIALLGSIFIGTALLFFGPPALRAETPVKHIRVIVDTSMSLHENDPHGYVKTATAMFYDLAWKVLNPNDTFEVVFFDP